METMRYYNQTPPRHDAIRQELLLSGLLWLLQRKRHSWGFLAGPQRATVMCTPASGTIHSLRIRIIMRTMTHSVVIREGRVMLC